MLSSLPEMVTLKLEISASKSVLLKASVTTAVVAELARTVAIVVPLGAFPNVKFAAERVVGLLEKLLKLAFVKLRVKVDPFRLVSINVVPGDKETDGVGATFVLVYHIGDVIVRLLFKVIST